jgi:hypothetical protein
MPEAAISGLQAAGVQVSGDPSAYNAKRIDDELSELTPTGSSASAGVNVCAKKGDSASARHIDARKLEFERDNLYSMPSRMMPPRIGAAHEWFAMRTANSSPLRWTLTRVITTLR